MEYLKTKQINKHNKTEQTHSYREQTGGCQREGVEGRKESDEKN